MNPSEIALGAIMDSPEDVANLSELARSEKSLVITTKKFIKFLKSEQVTKVKIGDISDLLSIPRRRLYDIVHVLEGVNLVQKMGKSDIIFKNGFLNDINLVVNKPDLVKKSNELTEKSTLLDTYISQLEAELTKQRQDPDTRNLNYVKKSRMDNCAPGKVLTVIKADPNAHIFTEIQSSENGKKVFVTTQPSLALSTDVLNTLSSDQKLNVTDDKFNVHDWDTPLTTTRPQSPQSLFDHSLEDIIDFPVKEGNSENLESICDNIDHFFQSSYPLSNDDDYMLNLSTNSSFPLPLSPFSSNSIFNISDTDHIRSDNDWAIPMPSDNELLSNDNHNEETSIYDKSPWKI